MNNTSTAQQIIDISLQLMMERGYNAFSFADVSQLMDIRKASIHYHFPTKADLGSQVVAYYRELVQAGIDELDRSTADPWQKLEWYVNGTAEQMRVANRICLCALLGAELCTLPLSVREEVQMYFVEHSRWLAGVLEAGRLSGQLSFSGAPDVQGEKLLAGIQGGMIAARVFGDAGVFERIARQLIADYKTRA